MIYAFYGFVLGFFIPGIARRLAKVLPAAAPEVLWRLITITKHPSRQKRCQSNTYKILAISYFYRCFIYALITGLIFFLATLHFNAHGLGAALVFLWSLLLLLEIDYKTFLLPDIITVPLLIGGFIFAGLYQEWITPPESAIGAAVGYLLPVISGLLIVKKHPDAFGGGDIKLLAAVGAWIGTEPIIYTTLLSCLLFGLFSLYTKRRQGAFGPAISIASIIVAFYFF